MLAIECDWRLRKLIRTNLEVLGLEVREAVSGQHGLELIQKRRPDLILLDLDLLDVDPRQMLDEVRDHLNGCPVPIILLSADPPGRDLIQHDCVSGFVHKPFAVSSLLHQIHQALGAEAVER